MQDKYILLSMICSASICLWHTIAAVLSSRINGDLLKQLDRYAAVSIASLFIILHAFFVVLIYFLVRSSSVLQIHMV